jgi:hypothetical protein
VVRILTVAAVVTGALWTAALAAGRAPHMSVYAPANRCLALRVPDGTFVVARGASYAASAPSRARAAAFYLKPTGLGTYMLYDRGARLMSAGPGDRVTRVATAGPSTEFALTAVGTGSQFMLRSTARHRRVAAHGRHGALALAGAAGTVLTLVGRGGCTPFPEAGVDATALSSPGAPLLHGRILGFVDDHVHITGNMRAGGDVISGEPYDRFGIPTALGQDAKVHGVNGKLDLTGNLLRTGLPIGTHDTHGWPTFKGWPTYSSMTHQQAYYVWLERAWRAGMRMVVAQTADDEPLCRLEPRRATRTCSETASILAQIRTLRGLQSYVDAQSGGPGKGWFRLVYNQAEILFFYDRDGEAADGYASVLDAESLLSETGR